MKTIWKYEILNTAMINKISIPAGSKIISVQAMNNECVIWAIVDTELELIERNFIGYETGIEIERDLHSLNYIGTFRLDGENYVCHLFEVTQ